MRKKLVSLFLVLCLLFTVLMPGCSKKPQSSAADGTKTADEKKNPDNPKLAADTKVELKGELKVWLQKGFLGAGDPSAPFYEYFQKNYPGLKLIEKDTKNEKNATTMITESIMSGDLPDVFLVSSEQLPIPTKLGYPEPLDEYLKKDPAFAKSLIQRGLDINKVDGKQYAIPINLKPFAVYCNLDLFDKMGVPHPNDEWNIDEFLEKAIKLTDPAQKVWGHGSSYTTGGHEFSVFEGYQVKGYKDNNGRKISNLAEDPDAITAIEKWMDITIRSNTNIPSNALKELGMDVYTAFKKGHVAMIVIDQGSQPYDADSNKMMFKSGVYRVPKGPKGRGNPINGWSLLIYSGSKNKELAWNFIKTVASQQFQQNLEGKDPKDPNKVIKPFYYGTDTLKIPNGLPPFIGKVQGHPDSQRQIDGFIGSLNDGVIYHYGGAGKVFINEMNGRALKRVINNEVQLIDALKEYDKWATENLLNAK